jgi:hypothetical protein
MKSYIEVQTQLPVDKLVKAVGQLSQADFEQFVQQVLALHAQSQAPGVPDVEADLLQKINQGLPPAVLQQYHALRAKLEDETLTPSEHAELLELTDRVENMEAQRVTYLAQLASSRQISISELMQQLGIDAVANE